MEEVTADFRIAAGRPRRRVGDRRCHGLRRIRINDEDAHVLFFINANGDGSE